ncbi:pseudoazurin [Rhodoferax sp. OV413]|uniref:plastocyanin/azurin family copper-binding protein n=1 Tax=Rhodoferax sp. OV413 TaxID=1855285 RepID=UPI000883D9C7|nr:plastocyanin/azurin family copper-binding protein [Rhodoferax sp. OV413]SDO18992.1 pseudoazurin [Rhodoferax sp. OV413]
MKTWLVAAWLCCSAGMATAAEHTVQMLNSGPEGSMVFSPQYLTVAVGDTVRFKAVNSGHYVRSLALPDGVEPWLSEEDQDYSVRIDQPGVYFYMCPPHLMMAMVGIIQAGAPVNLAQVREVAADKRGRILMNGPRFDALLGRLR